MALLSPPTANLGWNAYDFTLIGVDDKMHSLSQIKGMKATIIMFICNHCPYVHAIVEKIVQTANDLNETGIKSVAIMPNDTTKYSDDSLENMKIFSKENKFSFPYLIDDTQEIAKAYGAVCTPDFFIFDSELKLQYRGCLINKITNKNDLLDAAIQIASTGKTTVKEHPSMGCSIKWKEAP